MILAGDIGGTKTNLALYAMQDGDLRPLYAKQFASGDYTRFTDILGAFFREAPEHTVTSACFGIAGPVVKGECRTTNLPWETVTVTALQQHLGADRVALLNDLSVTAYGMLYLQENELVHLNPHAEAREATRCVIAAGTGLGEGILYYDGATYHPMATEGGHTDLAPLDPLEDALLLWLRERHPEHVSYERILSGVGIHTLYAFLKEYTRLPEPDTLLQCDPNSDKSALISRCALEEANPLCVKTLDLFCKIYGAEAGNLALKTLSLGGVYIGGGIAPKILPFMENGTFMESFLQKGRFAELLKKMEVKISLNQETALLGAAHYAKDKLGG